MSRDKVKDNQIFNCNQAHEIEYVASLYQNTSTVLMFLKTSESHQLFYSTYKEVYEFIQKELNLAIPI